MVDRGLAATGFEEVELSAFSSADGGITEITRGLADRYEDARSALSPSTRVDAFDIDLANELTRDGRRSGLTFAREGAAASGCGGLSTRWSHEEDLIATVAAAYGAGWRQVKLYSCAACPPRPTPTSSR